MSYRAVAYWDAVLGYATVDRIHEDDIDDGNPPRGRLMDLGEAEALAMLEKGEVRAMYKDFGRIVELGCFESRTGKLLDLKTVEARPT